MFCRIIRQPTRINLGILASYVVKAVMANERILLEKARAFHHETLGEIYDSYSPGIFRYGMRLLGDIVLAEECVSETFSRFLQALKNGR